MSEIRIAGPCASIWATAVSFPFLSALSSVITISYQSMKREDQQDATIRCLLLTSVSTCFGHHYARNMLRQKLIINI